MGLVECIGETLLLCWLRFTTQLIFGSSSNVASKLSKKRRQDWVFFCKKTVNCEGILLIFVLWKLEAIYMI